MSKETQGAGNPAYTLQKYLEDAGVETNTAKAFTQTVYTNQNTNTGSASASSQGAGTGGYAKPGEAGSLNVPVEEPGPVTTPGSGGGGGGGEGGGTTPDTPANPPLDWENYLQNWGFTPDIIDKLANIFSQYTDPGQASAAALAYIRGTSWYATTFPGIGAGESAGLFSDEAGYRSYINQLNQLYQSYYGRVANTNEITQFLTAGQSTTQVGQHLSGQAQLAAEQPQDQYQLGAFDPTGKASDNELSQYGDYLGGIGNMIGPQLALRIQNAQKRMNDIFQGTLATPSVSLATNGRLAAGSLGGNTSKPDIAS